MEPIGLLICFPAFVCVFSFCVFPATVSFAGCRMRRGFRCDGCIPYFAKNRPGNVLTTTFFYKKSHYF